MYSYYRKLLCFFLILIHRIQRVVVGGGRCTHFEVMVTNSYNLYGLRVPYYNFKKDSSSLVNLSKNDDMFIGRLQNCD